MNSAITLVKRGLKALGCLWLLAVATLGGLSAYFDDNPDAQKRLEVNARLAAPDSEMEAGLFTQVKAVIGAWWEAGDVIAEEKEAKTLAEKNRAEQRKEEQNRRFNENPYSYNDDYYPERN